MTLSISEIRSWDLSALSSAADKADTDAGTFEIVALSVTNGLAGLAGDWSGEARDQAEVRVVNETTNLNERAARWRLAGERLRTAASQLGLLKAEVDLNVDEAESKTSVVGPVYLVADDGGVSVSPAFVTLYAAQSGPSSGVDVVGEARANATELQRVLKRLLATAGVAAEYYDWLIANALLGVSDDQRPFKASYVPPSPPKPANPKQIADRQGTGPGDYDVEDSTFTEEMYMAGLRLSAVAGANQAERVAPLASDMLRHFFGNSGNDYQVDVDGLVGIPAFKSATAASAKEELADASHALPPGYTGPIVFEGDYSRNGVENTFRASPTESLDALGALGTFSYQTSGVAVPTSDGGYSIDYKTGIYDYYDWDPTGRTNSEQYSDLNDMHRSGWAQNFDVVGRSGVMTTESSSR